MGIRLLRDGAAVTTWLICEAIVAVCAYLVDEEVEGVDG